MACMCGATDCPSCGPAQGYFVEQRWVNGRLTWVNPEDDGDDLGDPEQDEPEEVPA